MPIRTQYQVLAQPPRQPDPNQFESFWHQPWVEPRTNLAQKLKAAVGVALVASGCVWSGFTPETITLDKWYPRFTEPVRVVPRLATGAQQYLAFGTYQPIVSTVDRWWQPFPTPSRVSTRIDTNQPFIFAAETITVDKWFVSWKEPLPKPVLARGNQQAFTGLGNPLPPVGYYYPFSEPVRSKLGLSAANQQFLAYTQFPIVVPPDRWWQPLSTPGRVLPRIDTTQPGVFATETITVDKWFAELSTPPKAKPRTPEFQAVAFGSYSPIVVPVDGWWGNLERPPRAAPRAAEYPAFTIAPTQPEAKDQIAWWQNLSTPPKAKPRTIEYPATAYGADPIVSTPDRWWQPLAEPPKAKPRAVEFLAFTSGAPTAEIVSLDKWFEPLSEPRTLSRARATDFPAFTYGARPIVNTTDQWWQNFATPPKAKPRAIEFQAVAYGARPIVVPVDGWWQNLSTPPKAKPRTVEYQAFTIGTPPFVAKVDSWWRNLETPPKAKPRAAEYRAFTAPDIQAEIREATFHFPWSEPVRIKPGLSVTNQQFIAQSESEQFPETVTESRWHQPWSEPVRVALRLTTGAQQFLALGWVNAPLTENITLDKWFAEWRDPVKLKVGLGARFHPSAQPCSNVFPLPNLDPSTLWPYTPFAEPVRVKLRDVLFQPFTYGPIPIIPTVTSWHQPLSVPPVLYKRRTAEYLSTVYARPPIVIYTDRYWTNFSTPPKPKVSLPVYQQQFLAFHDFQPQLVHPYAKAYIIV
jgi:hypothetical protein